MDKVFNIAVVGVGQLGSRHLQSLKQIELPVNLYVIDANSNSLHVAKERYDQIDPNLYIKSIQYSKDIADLPKILDLVILATSSRGRASLIKIIGDHSEVKNFVIEKILFQKEDEYLQIQKFLEDRGINAWVNCPRRLYPVYIMLNDWLKDNTNPIFGIVDGSNWGLGCNSIHYIDIFAQLSKCKEYSIATNLVDPNLINSKREGYSEFLGTLNLSFTNGSSLIISSRNDEGVGSYFLLSTGDKKFLIDEDAKQLSWYNKTKNGNWELSSFEIPFQSQLTSKIAYDILVNKTSGLTTYSDSMQLHLPLIKGLIKFLKETSDDATINNCPIT